MKRKAVLLLAATVAATTPVLASEETAKKHGKACEMETSACIRQMVEQVRDRGWIGIEFESPETPVIERVVAGSPADAAGIRVGDLWTGLDDLRFEGVSEKQAMQRVKELIKPGARLVFHALRAGLPVALDLEPSSVPQHILAQWVGQHVLEAHLEAPPPEGEAVVDKSDSKEGGGEK